MLSLAVTDVFEKVVKKIKIERFIKAENELSLEVFAVSSQMECDGSLPLNFYRIVIGV